MRCLVCLRPNRLNDGRKSGIQALLGLPLIPPPSSSLLAPNPFANDCHYLIDNYQSKF